MSFQAVEWARQLPLPGPYRFLTMVIGSYADTDGSCFPKLATLAEDTRQSVNTIRRQLVTLEKAGVLVRTARWRNAAGHIHPAEIGARCPKGFCRTSDNIALKMATDHGAVELYFAKTEAEPVTELETRSSQIGTTPSQNETRVVPPGWEEGGPTQVGVLESDSEKEVNITPLPPLQGGDCDQEFEKWFEDEFIPNYPDKYIADPDKARTAARKLSRETRRLAVKGAALYVASIARARSRGREPVIMHAHTWIRNKRWDGFILAEKAKEAQPQSAARMIPFPRESAEGRAIATLFAIARKTEHFHAAMLRQGQIWWRHGPLSPRFAALAKAPPRQHWVMLDHRQAGAWEEFLRECLPTLHHVMIRDAPWPWPPLKDGSISETGPPVVPGTLMTEADQEAMAREMG